MANSVIENEAARLAADARGIEFHYDLPAAFFRLFLDPTMSYSCHYFRTPQESLTQAALNKLQLVARKIALTADDRVLDIGCGWGSFVLWAAETYGCHVTGITLSPSQAAYVREQAAARGLADRVAVHVMHANAMTFPAASFDKIVTIGAIEHIEDLAGLWRDCRRLLRDGADARLLAHGMTVPVAARRESPASTLSGEETFIQEYIFPVGRFRHQWEVIRSLAVNDFEVIDVENITDHYTLTLRHWLANLMAHAGDLGAASGVPPERFRAQLLFLAGSAEAFAENRILCYQTLTRKLTLGAPRTPLPATREGYLLPEAGSRQMAEGRDAPVVPPESGDTTVVIEIAGDDPEIWTIAVRQGQAPQILPGPHEKPTCRLRIARDDFADLLDGRLRWTDAFVRGRTAFEGNLAAAIALRKLLMGDGA